MLPSPLYILFSKTRKLGKARRFTKIWIDGNRIGLRLNKDSPAIYITCDADLGQLN